MENFTPVSALLGGMLIGTAAVLLLALNGRIAGISGIVYGMAFAPAGDRLWRWMFIAGMLLAPLLLLAIVGTRPTIVMEASPLTIVLGGLLVGYGTQLGSGCTSGHGVCGMARLSPRSLVATALYVGMGMLTVTLVRITLGWFL